jgi:O-methyltransferase domain
VYLQAYDALPQGGALVAVDMLLDDDRRTAVESLARSLTMLIEFGGENAGEYTFKVRFCRRQWIYCVG